MVVVVVVEVAALVPLQEMKVEKKEEEMVQVEVVVVEVVAQHLEMLVVEEVLEVLLKLQAHVPEI